MPVGKGSITRAVKSQNKEQEKTAAAEEKATEMETAGGAAEKKPAQKKPVQKKPVQKKADASQEKPQAVSRIQCELPIYLL